MRRLLTLALLTALLVPPATALADGDPASDILLGQDVFYPYAPNTVSKGYQTALNAMTAKARKQGFGVKIALITSAGDLGSVPQLFTDPQKYADLLTQEISFNSKPRVLVVMPSGLGGNNLGDNAGTALSGVTPPSSDDPDGLARTAMIALGKLSTADGKPVAVPHVAAAAKSSSSGKSSTSPLLIFGAPVLLVALIALVARSRTAARDDDEDQQGDG